jgi:RHS repeat-associated protein
MGRVVKTIYPDEAILNQEYYLNGQLKSKYRARTYPVTYTYDAQGRMKTLTIWQDFAKSEGAAVTRWNYHPQRGWLMNKRYADNLGPDYEYYPAGKMKSRKWARGIETKYQYSAVGDVLSIEYSDEKTSGVNFVYDRLGRRIKVTQNGIETILEYTLFNQLRKETFKGGILDGIENESIFDELNRRTNHQFRIGELDLISQAGYEYDLASRLNAVKSGETRVAYIYLENSGSVEKNTFKHGMTVSMKTKKEYERLNRLQSIESKPANEGPISFRYQYNQANQRTAMSMDSGEEWQYAYDALGQVIQGNKKSIDKQSVKDAQFAYSYDDIGNRKQDSVDDNAKQYDSDLLNGYKTIAASGKSMTAKYDADGNLINDGQWKYNWDAENRLIGMGSVAGVPPADQKRLVLQYGWQSRRISQKVYEGRNNKQALSRIFVYDGWNLVAEFSDLRSPATDLRSYLWGLDLSGRFQGVGGVGGLLKISSKTEPDIFVSYDGNGNITGLTDATTGTPIARSEYSPFGEVIHTSANRSAKSPFRFSTKYQDDETGLLYYGYPYFSPNTGKWQSRDPIEDLWGETKFYARTTGDLGLWLNIGYCDHGTFAEPSFWNNPSDNGESTSNRFTRSTWNDDKCCEHFNKLVHNP